MGRECLSRLYIGHLPMDISEDDLKSFLLDSGHLAPHSFSLNFKKGFAFMICNDQATADLAIDRFHGISFKGENLCVEPAVRNYSGQPKKIGRCLKAGNCDCDSERPRFPWRMLVPANQVGALIGKGGATIRGITQATGARINIHTGQSGARNRGDVEKVLSIVGSPEKCTAACRQILELLAQDLSKSFGCELALRIIAFDSLIGRVIGKGGANITKIMQESKARVHISNIHDQSRNFGKNRREDCDRIITIRGSIGGMVQAESLISQKLRASYESDVYPHDEPVDHAAEYTSTSTTTSSPNYQGIS